MDRDAEGAGAAAEVYDGRAWWGEQQSLRDQVLRTPAWHEHAWVEQDPQAAEVCVADDVFERQPGDALLNHVGELGVVAGRGDQQVRLVLGEDAAGGAEGADDG
jgi:hypothetical protein